MKAERAWLVLLLGCLCAGVSAQSLSPSVVGAWGTSATGGGITLDQTIGEVAVRTEESGNIRLTQGFHQSAPIRVRLHVRAFLQGPYSGVTGLMADSLRRHGVLPLAEPYSAMGLPGGGEVTTAMVFATGGADAIVDWVHLELRGSSDATVLVQARNALLQADGDIVDVDGLSPVAFAALPGSYYIILQHRNHLGVMGLDPLALTTAPALLDLTSASTANYGSAAQASQDGMQALWTGDVNGDGIVKYTGAGNDRDVVLFAIGGSVPTATVAGYAVTDVNLDGTTKYTGANNDRDPMLQTIGGAVPTAVRQAQLPELSPP